MPTAKKKVAIVGDCETGKTYLWRGYFDGRFADDAYAPTALNIGERLSKKTVLDVWDASGHDDYDRLRPLAYRDVDAVIVCYSIDRPDSLIRVMGKWALEVRHFGGRVPVVLVGTKKDIRDDFTSAYNSGLATFFDDPVPEGRWLRSSVWSPWKGKKSSAANGESEERRESDGTVVDPRKSFLRRKKLTYESDEEIPVAASTSTGGEDDGCSEDPGDCTGGETTDVESGPKPDRGRQRNLQVSVDDGESSRVAVRIRSSAAGRDIGRKKKSFGSRKRRDERSSKSLSEDISEDVENDENADPNRKPSAGGRTRSVWSPWNGDDWPNKFLDLTFLSASSDHRGIEVQRYSAVENDGNPDPEKSATPDENVTREQIIGRVTKQLMLSTWQGQEMAKKIEAFAFFECSAKTQEGVKEVFSAVVQAAKLKRTKRKISTKYFRPQCRQ